MLQLWWMGGHTVVCVMGGSYAFDVTHTRLARACDSWRELPVDTIMARMDEVLP